jgi:hypothetical protein
VRVRDCTFSETKTLYAWNFWSTLCAWDIVRLTFLVFLLFFAILHPFSCILPKYRAYKVWRAKSWSKIPSVHISLAQCLRLRKRAISHAQSHAHKLTPPVLLCSVVGTGRFTSYAWDIVRSTFFWTFLALLWYTSPFFVYFWPKFRANNVSRAQSHFPEIFD